MRMFSHTSPASNLGSIKQVAREYRGERSPLIIPWVWCRGSAWSMTSSDDHSQALLIWHTWKWMLPKESTTPLGGPVVPLVYMMSASWSFSSVWIFTVRKLKSLCLELECFLSRSIFSIYATCLQQYENKPHFALAGSNKHSPRPRSGAIHEPIMALPHRRHLLHSLFWGNNTISVIKYFSVCFYIAHRMYSHYSEGLQIQQNCLKTKGPMNHGMCHYIIFVLINHTV